MTPNDILESLKLALPNINISEFKTMRDNDRALLVTTTNGKQMIFETLAPDVWSCESVKHYKKRRIKE